MSLTIVNAVLCQELDIYTYADGINLNYFSEDGEWEIQRTWNERATYTEGNYEYARVYYYFKLKRKPLYYGLNMILPVLVTALLTVFVFLLPAESGEKIGYCLTVLLAFMVILTLIAADLPTTAANTSLLGRNSLRF
ncbi:neuronal acetylcholine receptor subunit alpha-3 [Elysia marginata]|uniref:Neuronal acetylcholine receptor subunit alpha-3 n=1 Tax=Elysia marginata TaxID=1093978 RepID=A0AAV4F0X7_9GAST|nr:neuronal acetylcholine receptor subunit alpha-3 [Elysia marginata]